MLPADGHRVDDLHNERGSARSLYACAHFPARRGEDEPWLDGEIDGEVRGNARCEAAPCNQVNDSQCGAEECGGDRGPDRGAHAAAEESPDAVREAECERGERDLGGSVETMVHGGVHDGLSEHGFLKNPCRDRDGHSEQLERTRSPEIGAHRRHPEGNPHEGESHEHGTNPA